MNYEYYFLELTKRINSPVYLCNTKGKTMQTFYEGELFEEEMPEWMIDFMVSPEIMLPFVNDNVEQQYFKWQLDSDNFAIFLDQPNCPNLVSIMSFFIHYAVEIASEKSNLFKSNKAETERIRKELEVSEREKIKLISELEVTKSRMQQNKLELEHERQEAKKALEEAKEEIISLREQNRDQAARLREALSQNLDMQHQLKKPSGKNVPADDEEIKRIKLENERLIKQMGRKETPPAAKFNRHEVSMQTGGLKELTNALEKAARTGDTSLIDMDMIATVLSISEYDMDNYEDNPRLLENLAAKINGMEKRRQLSDTQIRILANCLK